MTHETQPWQDIHADRKTRQLVGLIESCYNVLNWILKNPPVLKLHKRTVKSIQCDQKKFLKLWHWILYIEKEAWMWWRWNDILVPVASLGLIISRSPASQKFLKKLHMSHLNWLFCMLANSTTKKCRKAAPIIYKLCGHGTYTSTEELHLPESVLNTKKRASNLIDSQKRYSE